MRLWRVTALASKEEAFNGYGSARWPGRWNQRGRRAVYAATSIPLGVLEVLVQAGSAPLAGYRAYPTDVPDGLIERFDVTRLAPTWRSIAGRDECRTLGDEWRASGSSVGLIVPSAVVPEAYDAGDYNVVLRPDHPEWSQVAVDDPIPLNLDARIAELLAARSTRA